MAADFAATKRIRLGKRMGQIEERVIRSGFWYLLTQFIHEIHANFRID